MSFNLNMPKLSPTMESGTIAKWLKKEGDYVEAGEPLIEVATDKATVEHSALDEGWLRKILVHEGEEAKVNEAVAIFTEKENEDIGELPETPKEPSPEEEKKEEPEKPSTDTKVEKQRQPAFVPEPPLEQEKKAPISDHIKASPLAKKIAKEKNLDLTLIKGTGPDGRIIKRDLERAPSSLPQMFYPQKTSLPGGSYEEIPLSPIRKVIAERLQASKSFIPHFYVSQEVDAEALQKIRTEFAAFSLKITVNDLIMRATALSLADHPEVNSGFNSENQTIIRFQTIDLSVAVDTDNGLITPIIRHANEKPLRMLSQEIRALAAKAKQGKLSPEEYKGGSFTISNLGMYGVSNFQAIINPPQAAILSVSGIKSLPVVKDGMIVPGERMQLTLSADHRVIDGVEGAKFLNTLKKLLENPSLLLI